MEKILNYLSEVAKHLHIPLVIGGYFQLLSREEPIGETKESNRDKIWGDDIPHFIFSDNY